MTKGWMKLCGSAAVCALALGFAAPAAAQEKAATFGTFSANVALTSEYFFRGLSQTDDAPAIQGGFDWEAEVAKPVALYLGVWGSNVDFNEGAGVDGATVEIDFYGGLKGKFGNSGVTWDAGFIYYAYPGAASNLNYDFWELQAAVGYDFGVAAVTASINYSPDNFGESGDAYYPKLAVDVPIPTVKGLSLSGYIAKQYIEKEVVFGTADYVEWNFGVTYNVAGFDLSLNYTDTDVDPSGDGNDGAVVFTVGRSF